MNDVDLREQFHNWAAPLRAAAAPEFAGIRRRARRRTARLAALAGGTAAAIAVAVSLVGGVLTGPAGGPDHVSHPASFWGQSRYPAPGQAPYVFINGSASGSPMIGDAASGRIAGRLATVGTRGIFGAAAVTSNDRLFVLAQQSEADRITFAEARITPSGSVLLRRILPGISVAASQIYGMTVNPAGTRLVLNTWPAGRTGAGKLLVYDLTAGTLVDSWPENHTGVVTFQYWPTADRLALYWQDSGSLAYSGLRILNTAVRSAGPSLAAATQPGPDLRGYHRGAFTADGSVALNMIQSGSAEVLQEFSARSGALLRTIPIGTARAQQDSPDFCGVLWASADGRELLTQCGRRQQEVVNGTVTRVKLAWNFLAPQTPVTTFAW
ncbi:MAG TPA: hypothetical protein VNW50_21525 [Streptosporangiaceae bacterium]|nr:hypothetical protein [Streptosporangiaceae bacterium]